MRENRSSLFIFFDRKAEYKYPFAFLDYMARLSAQIWVHCDKAGPGRAILSVHGILWSVKPCKSEKTLDKELMRNASRLNRLTSAGSFDKHPWLSW